MSIILKSYPEYKDSGLPWLGKIPVHWSAHRLKRVCRLGYGDSLTSVARLSGDVPVYGSNGRVGYHNTPNTLGPCIIVGRKGSFGKVNYSPQPVFAIDTTFFVDARLTEESLRWLYYVLSWVRLDDASRDSAIPGLDRGEAYERIIPTAPMEEQHQIAAFLDSHDYRINRLIRAKRRLIELLNEQKQAIIHNAVTGKWEVRRVKGENGGVASHFTPRPSHFMKPSGIDWLGDLPEHWEVGALRRFWEVVDCKHLTVPFVEDGIPLASVVEVQSFDLDLTHCKSTTEEWYQHLISGGRKPRRGDLIYCRNASVGACTYVNTDIDFAMGQDVCLLTSGTQNQRYLNYLLHSWFMAEQLERLLVGSTFKRINISNIRVLVVLVPPRSEQDAICNALDDGIAEIASATQRANREIDLLREYRTRLIANVVTGKLDVRGVELPALDEVDVLDDIETSEDAEANGTGTMEEPRDD